MFFFFFSFSFFILCFCFLFSKFYFLVGEQGEARWMSEKLSLKCLENRNISFRVGGGGWGGFVPAPRWPLHPTGASVAPWPGPRFRPGFRGCHAEEFPSLKTQHGRVQRHRVKLLQHGRVQRHRVKLLILCEFLNTCKERFGARSFRSSAPALWNSLPQSLKVHSSSASFKCQLKTHVFSKF